MRIDKCREIFKELSGDDKKNIILIKCPPASGKTFFAHLFIYYLKNIEKIKAENVKYLDPVFKADGTLPIIEYFENRVGLTTNEIENNSLKGKPTKYLVLDETQILYKKEFEKFWRNIKSITEYNKNLKILCFAAYGSVRSTDLLRENGTPMVFLEKNTKTFSFLRFTKTEVQEIVESYDQDFNESQKFKIDQEIMNYIQLMTGNHAELVSATIDYLSQYLKNNVPNEKGFKKVKELMNSSHYHEMIKNLKGSPCFLKITNPQQKELIKTIFIRGGLEILSEDPIYKLAKELEDAGILYDHFETRTFRFVSDLIGQSVFSRQFQIDYNFLKDEEVITMEKKNLILQILKRMDKFSILNAYKLKNEKSTCIDKSPAEDQWICEFYRALKTLLNPKKFVVICQAHLEVNCIGELDLFINSLLNLAIEATTEGNTIRQHIDRRYNGTYNLSSDAVYFVIDFRAKMFYNVESLEGYKHHLIRVHYLIDIEQESVKFQVHFNEDKKDFIELTL